jgi:hypothetical protein
MHGSPIGLQSQLMPVLAHHGAAAARPSHSLPMPVGPSRPACRVSVHGPFPPRRSTYAAGEDHWRWVGWSGGGSGVGPCGTHPGVGPRSRRCRCSDRQVRMVRIRVSRPLREPARSPRRAS